MSTAKRLAEADLDNPRKGPRDKQSRCQPDNTEDDLTDADPAHPRHHGAILADNLFIRGEKLAIPKVLHPLTEFREALSHALRNTASLQKLGALRAHLLGMG